MTSTGLPEPPVKSGLELGFLSLLFSHLKSALTSTGRTARFTSSKVTVKEYVTDKPSMRFQHRSFPLFGIGPVATSVKKSGSNAADFLTKGDRATRNQICFREKNLKRKVQPTEARPQPPLSNGQTPCHDDERAHKQKSKRERRPQASHVPVKHHDMSQEGKCSID